MIPNGGSTDRVIVDQDERLLLSSSFGTAAVAYAEHRPDYAQAAVRWTLGRTPGQRVLDLGAGTGKLIAALRARRRSRRGRARPGDDD